MSNECTDIFAFLAPATGYLKLYGLLKSKYSLLWPPLYIGMSYIMTSLSSYLMYAMTLLSALKSYEQLFMNSSSFTQSGMPFIILRNSPSLVICDSLLPKSNFTRKMLLSRTNATIVPSGENLGTCCAPFCDRGSAVLFLRLKMKCSAVNELR